MAGAQVTVVATQVEKQRLGYQAISLTNFALTTEPQITAGSKVEIGSALYEFNALESITGWAGIANSSIVYILLTPAGAIVTASFTTSAPAWDDAKQGWYSGANRMIGGLYKDSSGNYTKKWLYTPGQSGYRQYGDRLYDVMPIGTIIMYDAANWIDNVTLPGWYACIAANAGYGCPDLVDMFIIGKVVAGAGVDGGATSKTIAASHLPKHTHTLPITTAVGLGGYSTPVYIAGSMNSGSGPGATDYLDISSGSYSVVFIRKCY